MPNYSEICLRWSQFGHNPTELPLDQFSGEAHYSTIEMALRIRLDKPDEVKCNLRPMLEEALAKGFLQDKLAPETIPDLRNLIAHGSPMNGPWSVQMLRRCAETINELFAESKMGNP
jgi:hypothetical protein